MNTKLKIIVLSIVMFAAGIVSARAFEQYVEMPNIAKDISKFAYEAAYNGYQAGYVDATNNDTVMYDTYFNEEAMQEINNQEYKYIK